MKSISNITLSIKGRDWQFILLTDGIFDKKFNPGEEDNNSAMTLPNQYIVYFRKSDWCIKDIIHELGHVLFSMSDVHTANLTPDQVEETMCEIMASNYFEIGLWVNRISEKFFARE